ncbi:MAG: hypothetical protein K5989_10505 [Lachnospiraceae bacterium]|nr:hypothetical protein [Lachnospiraceae bacterium]
MSLVITKGIRKISTVLAVILLCLISLTGCGISEMVGEAVDSAVKKIFGTPGEGLEKPEITGFASESGEDHSSPYHGEEPVIIEETESAVTEEFTVPEAGAIDPVEQDDDDASEKDMEDERNYCFSIISTPDKQLYMELYNCFYQMRENVLLSTLDADRVDRIFNYVMMDHPELFFVEGYRITQTTRDGVPVQLEISGRYTCSAEDRIAKEQAIRARANEVLKGVPEDGNEYEKVKYIFEWIIDNTEYNLSAPENQNITSVFLNGESVCQGYSMAAKYLLDRMGIFCTIVYGRADGESHSWNLVRMDGTYCYMDTTWGDASYRNSDSAIMKHTNYNYFGCNDEILLRTHQIDSPAPLPPCTSLDEYFYVKESRYFTSPDLERLRAIFEYERKLGSHVFSIRCSDETVYNTMKQELFENNGIFDLLPDSRSVKYIKDDREYTLSFSV